MVHGEVLPGRGDAGEGSAGSSQCVLELPSPGPTHQHDTGISADHKEGAVTPEC